VAPAAGSGAAGSGFARDVLDRAHAAGPTSTFMLWCKHRSVALALILESVLTQQGFEVRQIATIGAERKAPHMVVYPHVVVYHVVVYPHMAEMVVFRRCP